MPKEAYRHGKRDLLRVALALGLANSNHSPRHFLFKSLHHVVLVEQRGKDARAREQLALSHRVPGHALPILPGRG